MIRFSTCTAPARLLMRAGAALIVAVAGCEGGGSADDAGPRVLELSHDTIQLPAGARLIDIAVQVGAAGEFDPASATARPGDVIRFTARDRGSHAIAFDAAALDPPVREYLDRTGQLRGPPLIDAGSAWVVSLDGAPPGAYPFRCTTHDRSGRITVEAR